RFVNGRFDALRELYGRALGAALQLRWTLAIAALLITAAAVPLYSNSKKELAPTEDEGFVFAFFESAPDANLEFTLRGVQEVARRAITAPDAEFFFNVTQSTGGFGGLKSINWNKRERKTSDMKTELFGKVMTVAGVTTFPSLPAPLPGAGM